MATTNSNGTSYDPTGTVAPLERERRPLPRQPPSGLVSMSRSVEDTWAHHPGYGLTPRRLVRVFAQADVGLSADQCDLFDDVVMRDGHLRAALDSRRDSVLGKDWIMQAGGDAPADQTAARVLEDACRDVPNFHATLKHHLGVHRYGYAATEIEWGERDGWYVPIWFANVAPRRFRFDLWGYPRLLTPDNRVDGEELMPGRWIWTALAECHPQRAALMRTAAWWSLFKGLAVTDWQVFAARFGLPYVQGKYDATATDTDKAALREAVAHLGSDGSAIYERSCEVEMLMPDGGGKTTDVHGAIATFANAEMSKLITGATLTSETQGPGSYALGAVHANVRFDKVAADERLLGASFARQLGAAFVAYNGITARAPRLKIAIQPEVDPLTRARIASVCANEIGMILDEEQMRQEFQFKAPAAGRGLKGTKVGDGASGV